MAAGAVSLRKSHDIAILSFCNIVKGQAKCTIIPITCFSYDIMRKWIICIIACQNFSLSDEIFQIISNEIMIISDVFIRITYFIISSMKKWEKQLISHSKCTYIVELLHKNVIALDFPNKNRQKYVCSIPRYTSICMSWSLLTMTWHFCWVFQKNILQHEHGTGLGCASGWNDYGFSISDNTNNHRLIIQFFTSTDTDVVGSKFEIFGGLNFFPMYGLW